MNLLISLLLVPSASQENIDGKIEYTLTDETKSDMLLLKCPDSKYKATNLEDFRLNEDIQTSKLTIRSNDSSVIWVFIKKESGLTKKKRIECGEFYKSINNVLTKFEWIIYIKWDDYKENLIYTYSNKLKEVSNNKCKNSIIISIEKDGSMMEINMNNLPKANFERRFYFFSKNDLSRTSELIKPCVITKLYISPPRLVIRNDRIFNKINGSNSMKVIKLNSSNSQKKLAIKILPTDVNEEKDFYSGTNVEMKKYNFRDGKLIEIKNSMKTITKYFSINGSEIVGFFFIYTTKDGIKDFKEFIFFGPDNDNIIIEESEIKFSSKNQTILPNCSTDLFTYAYLEKINHNGMTTNNLSSLESKKFTFIENEEEYEQGNLGSMLNNLGLCFFILFWLLLTFMFIIIGYIFGYYIIYQYIRVTCELRYKKNEYRNIFALWEILATGPFNEYCCKVLSKDYIAGKVKRYKIKLTVDGGEELEISNDSLFDDSLVSCYNDIGQSVKAHYIDVSDAKRNYILSDAPTKEAINEFFELLYYEDVSVVVAIINDDDTNRSVNKNSKSYFYWPLKKEKFGSVTVEPIQTPQTIFISGYIHSFRMDMNDEKNYKIITFLHVSGWKEFEIPSSSNQIINIYENVIKFSNDKQILIHTSQGSGVRAYMFAYFSIITESMLNNNKIDNPLEVVREIREKRYGGYMSSKEFGFIIYSMINYFFHLNILQESGNHLKNFYNNYENYIYENIVKDLPSTKDIKELLQFSIIVDEGRILEMCEQSRHVQMLSDKILKDNCKRFYKTLGSKFKDKIKYPSIECLDNSGIIIKNKSVSDPENFIHANMMTYKCHNHNDRRIIMCQAVQKNGIDDMIDMLYNYNVGIVVLLCQPEECLLTQDKWYSYFPINKKSLHTGTYVVERVDRNKPDKFFTVSTTFKIIKNNVEQIFKVFHYQNWPNKDIPTDHKSVHELYKRILLEHNDRTIAINCSGGIGRSGTFAFIMLLLDTMSKVTPFDPIKSLAFLRSYRYRAVTTSSQFLFAITVVYEHYKEEIEKHFPGNYGKFMELVKKRYNEIKSK
uniref:Tyrosine-protein phosphatase domain-containing protein n=1 Tax=Parastrongyloides trichosuri TaxID=131310 RepID=A0A0N4ZEV2_PARTI